MRLTAKSRFGFAQNEMGFCDGYIEVLLVK